MSKHKLPAHSVVPSLCGADPLCGGRRDDNWGPGDGPLFLETKKHKGELTPFIRFADQFGLSDCVDCVENEKVGTIRYTVLSELESEAKTFESEAKECPSWAQSPV